MDLIVAEFAAAASLSEVAEGLEEDVALEVFFFRANSIFKGRLDPGKFVFLSSCIALAASSGIAK